MEIDGRLNPSAKLAIMTLPIETRYTKKHDEPMYLR